MMRNSRFFVSALTFLLFAAVANAADYHLTPTGSGRKDGSGWENAFDQTALSSAVNEKLSPGDRLLIGSGVFKDVSLTITAGGTEAQPKIIVGVDRGSGLPVFTSNWDVEKPDKGQAALRIAPGVSHLSLQHLRLKGYMAGVHASPVKEAAAVRSHLSFEDVDIEEFRYGFYLSDCDDLLFSGCDLKRYTKHGFRFEQGCDRVTLRGCSADCSEGDAEWENKTELLPFGFTLNDGGIPNTHFLFEDCLARNNMKPNQRNRYLNGDGFVAEGNSANVTFVRCRSIRNQDGGFDLKVPDVKLTDCIAIGNKRGYRIWQTGTLINCFAGWGPTGLWCNGGPLTANRCTFHAAEAAAVMTDDKATEPITLKDCIISIPSPDASRTRPTLGKVVLSGTVLTGNGSEEKAPAYKAPDQRWDGVGDAMDSQIYPNKGYHSGKRSQ